MVENVVVIYVRFVYFINIFINYLGCVQFCVRDQGKREIEDYFCLEQLGLIFTEL